ncbi:hypothetical protein GCM10010168_26350 [Actinoplanes ianthinogenes]|uniref:Secreted protein n=1 Tax=Actinoplanes ianthinogenes TaxID=122358 RepID=A0ABM7M9E3_9ACTN|nr:septal ring lytic transglycosylase RlpA family protein [Actinoplanes ianthinogenes]BCJ48275.1 hypothetical protein Aiant_89320 [Actinoplanes ianthinogenes]GGR07623.1 hypothetical protein GCM10010168_26350 [Actinoplanes ianthinogenes]
MYRTRRQPFSGTSRKVMLALSAVALVGGAFAVSTGVSSAGENGATESCVGLDQALRQNLQFIAGQKANPDAQSAGRIANRQAVVDLINQRRATAGCTADVAGEVAAGAGKQNNGAGQAAQNGAGKQNNGAGQAAQNGAGQGAQAAGQSSGGGEVVCKGSTVTLSGEGGAPAASSGTFPAGTVLKVTNLDNNKSITVKVTSVSGSCVLLNNAAFEQVREPGKFLIRRAVIERVG